MSDDLSRTVLEEQLKHATIRIINREANMQLSGVLVALENDGLIWNEIKLLYVIISCLHGMDGLNRSNLAHYDFQVRLKACLSFAKTALIKS